MGYLRIFNLYFIKCTNYYETVFELVRNIMGTGKRNNKNMPRRRGLSSFRNRIILSCVEANIQRAPMSSYELCKMAFPRKMRLVLDDGRSIIGRSAFKSITVTPVLSANA